MSILKYSKTHSIVISFIRAETAERFHVSSEDQRQVNAKQMKVLLLSFDWAQSGDLPFFVIENCSVRYFIHLDMEETMKGQASNKPIQQEILSGASL